MFAIRPNLKHAALITFPKTSSSFVNRKTSKRMPNCKWISQSRQSQSQLHSLQFALRTKSLSCSSSSTSLLHAQPNLPLSHGQSKCQLCVPLGSGSGSGSGWSVERDRGRGTKPKHIQQIACQQLALGIIPSEGGRPHGNICAGLAMTKTR